MASYSYHCGQLMAHQATPLLSGNVLHNFTCKYCGHRERTVVSRNGSLLSWRNQTLVQSQPA